MELSSEETEPAAKRRKRRKQSAESVKNDRSKDEPLISSPRPGPRLRPRPEAGSQSGVSAVSMKSDNSKQLSIVFSPGSKPGPESQYGGSAVSMRSDFSKELNPAFSPGPKPGPASQSGVSAVSMKSDCSRREPLTFSPGSGPASQIQGLEDLSGQTQLDNIFRRLEEEILAFVKQQLQEFKLLLSSGSTSQSTLQSGSQSASQSSSQSSSQSALESSSQSALEGEERCREAMLNITLDFLKRMDQEGLAHRLSKGSVGVCRDELKSHLKHRVSQVFEGVATAERPVSLQQIYTDLHIIEGEDSEVNQEHEVRHIESMSRRPAERTITSKDIFKQQAESEQPTRTVLTKGVAGVGKTVLTQKFTLDWAEDKANQDIQLLLPFTFRELNVLKDRTFTLVELLHHCFSQTKRLSSFEDLPVLFILDGLDECRLLLDFRRIRVLTDPTESASVEELLVNLIRGSLLPYSYVWITTRPVAANQIPAEYVSMVTEVRGFTDPQKDQYFEKRFTDEQQAKAVVSHVKNIRSLYIMSSIPIFCWITSTVLQKILVQSVKPELPKTLTQMYVHFLVVQVKVKILKYHGGSGADPHWTPETKTMVWSLGKLAFEQLLKGNLIFYEFDLRECGLDAAEIARYSGVFTEVFREEPGLYQDRVYCFIHLTVQEFLAALHVHQTFFSSGQNLLSPPYSYESHDPEPTPEELFYRCAVDQALQSPNGHLDLFLRFLLGLSLSTNQNLLRGLLTQTGRDLTNQETVKYIHKKLNEGGVSVDRSLNLLHCLNELNDRSLVPEIQKILRGGRLSNRNLSPAQWSAVSFVLLSSDSDLEQFDFKKYCPSEEALQGLLPVIKASTKANLSCCGLTSLSCTPLASVLSSSSLTLLDLSNNDFQDSGVELLCEGLKSAPCRLESLKLSGCLVSEKGGASLATVLNSASSALRELDLSYNHPGASAELLTALQKPQGPLHTLRLDPAGECWMVPGLRKYAWQFSLDPNTVSRSLHLSEDLLSVTKVTELQPYPDHQDRFTGYANVLSSTGMRGRCYWEVDWRKGGEEGAADVAVSYRGIKRTGRDRESLFGANDQSWSLRIFNDDYHVHHRNDIKRLRDRVGVSSGRVGVSSGRVGVFLDWEGGALSFYEVVSDGGLSHLHTVHTSFTEPVFPGFRLFDPGDSVSVVKM